MSDACYEYIIYGDEKYDRNFLLPSLKATYILTLEVSDRLTQERLKHLRTFCRTTIVQVNTKHKTGCVKPSCTKRANHDIVHAHRQACHHAEKRYGETGNILILEDDAIVRDDANEREFDSIDSFISLSKFDVYSLGSVGMHFPFQTPDHIRLVNICFSQAIVWSPSARKKILSCDVCSIKHVDGHFLSYLRLKYTWRRPLVLQLLTATENSKEWCALCRDGVVGKIEHKCVTLVIHFFRMLRLDKDALPGWDILNIVSYCLLPVCTVVVIILVYLVTFLKKKKP